MYTVDDLISNVRIRAAIPTSQQLFTPARLTALLTDEMQSNLIPQILSVREDYFLTYLDYAQVSSGQYDMPEFAIGMKLENVCLVDSNGENIRKLPRLNRTQLEFENSPQGFYIQGNTVILQGEFPSSSSIRMYYFRRGNILVPNVEAGKITSIDTVNNTVVLDNVPASWVVGTSVCIVKGKPGFDLRTEATPIVSLSSPTVGIADVSELSVGDWIALEGYTPVVQLPVEAHPVLVQSVVVKCLEALGDANGMAAAQNKLNELRQQLFTVISPRVDGSVKKIVPPFRHHYRF